MKAFFKSDPKPHRTKAIRKSIADRETSAVKDDQPATYKAAVSGTVSAASPIREIKPDDPQPAMNHNGGSRLVRSPSTKMKAKRDDPEVWEDARLNPVAPPKDRFMSERDVSITEKDEQKHRRNMLQRAVVSPKAEMPNGRHATITEKAQLEASPDENQVNDVSTDKNLTTYEVEYMQDQIENLQVGNTRPPRHDQGRKDNDGAAKENKTKGMEKSSRTQIGNLEKEMEKENKRLRNLDQEWKDKNDSAKENQAKENQAKENQAKENQAKENQAKENQAKENQAKETEKSLRTQIKNLEMENKRLRDRDQEREEASNYMYNQVIELSKDVDDLRVSRDTLLNMVEARDEALSIQGVSFESFTKVKELQTQVDALTKREHIQELEIRQLHLQVHISKDKLEKTLKAWNEMSRSRESDWQNEEKLWEQKAAYLSSKLEKQKQSAAALNDRVKKLDVEKQNLTREFDVERTTLRENSRHKMEWLEARHEENLYQKNAELSTLAVANKEANEEVAALRRRLISVLKLQAEIRDQQERKAVTEKNELLSQLQELEAAKDGTWPTQALGHAPLQQPSLRRSNAVGPKRPASNP